VRLSIEEWNEEADLWANASDTRFKAAKSSARAAVASYLVIKIADRADVKLVVKVRGNSPIQVSVSAALVLRVGIDEIVRQAEHHGCLNSRSLVEIGVADASIDCPMAKPER